MWLRNHCRSPSRRLTMPMGARKICVARRVSESNVSAGPESAAARAGADEASMSRRESTEFFPTMGRSSAGRR
ncbi:MAG: hypothetical protein A2882_15440 [Phenylobacterium sp. RIFCSPHIGHO2_01_FULL_70_10]|nr:MAG: hypothetical protein A2882_15440 [Phenylobacterium sp. RIFCSPHIGHO2_01_FULL_70_10]